MLSVMSNPKRLAILFCLMEGEMSFDKIAAKTGLRQSPLSQHLAILRRYKFVSARRIGPFAYYLLISKPAISVLKTLEQIYFTDE